MSTFETNDEDSFIHYQFLVDRGQSSIRIDKYLTERIEGITRNRIQNSIDRGCIKANGVVVKANYRVKPADFITIEFDYERRELEILAEDIALDIVFEDEYLLVVNKPAGIVVHPGHGNYTGTLVNALAFHFQKNGALPSNDPRIGLVHRIDKDTSGLLVVAKTEEVRSGLSLQFFNKTTKRSYKALVWGNVKDKSGTIVGNIGRSPKDRLQFCVYEDITKGKYAVTHYRVLERLAYVSLIECVLETGRTHQIRVHVGHIGHTIFNDTRYGGNEILKGEHHSKYKQFVNNCFAICPRQALHAEILGFIHPISKEEMIFTSPIPKEFEELLEKWRKYAKNGDLRD